MHCPAIAFELFSVELPLLLRYFTDCEPFIYICWLEFCLPVVRGVRLRTAQLTASRLQRLNKHTPTNQWL